MGCMPTRLRKGLMKGMGREKIFQVNNVDVEYPVQYKANRYKDKRSSSTVKISGGVHVIEGQCTVNDTEEQHR